MLLKRVPYSCLNSCGFQKRRVTAHPFSEGRLPLVIKINHCDRTALITDYYGIEKGRIIWLADRHSCRNPGDGHDAAVKSLIEGRRCLKTVIISPIICPVSNLN